MGSPGCADRPLAAPHSLGERRRFRSPSPRLGAFLAVVFWGVSFVATKAAVAECGPVALIFGRAGIGALWLIAVLALRREPVLPPRDAWVGLCAMGFVGVAFHQVLQAYALTLTTASRTGWLIGLTPVWSALLAAWRLREPMGRDKLAGLVMGLSGALLVVTRGRFEPGLLALPSTRGDLLILASTLNWAFYTVLGHSLIRRLGPTRATAGAMTAGFLMLVPLALYEQSWHALARLSPAGWGALLFLGIACSGLGYLFWYGALERVEASRVAAFLYLEPLIALAAAMVLLGETVALTTVLGGLLLIAGVVVIQRAR